MPELAWCLTLGMVAIMLSSIDGQTVTKRFRMDGMFSGSFSSPGYPKRYPENVSYRWVFPAYEHDVVLIKFIKMELYLCYVYDRYEDCSNYDYVAIQGHSKFCNWRKPTDTIILSQHTVIEFRSLYTTDACRGKGFNATFKVTSSSSIYGKKTEAKAPTISPDKDPDKGGKEHKNDTKTTGMIIGTVIGASAAITTVLVCALCWKYRKRERHRQHNRNNRTRSAIPEQETVMRYSALQRNEDHSSEQTGPPPTYDSVYNTRDTSSRDGRHNVNSDFEFPPSYETVMRETSPGGEGRQTAERRHETRRANAHAQRIPTEPRRIDTPNQGTVNNTVGTSGSGNVETSPGGEGRQTADRRHGTRRANAHAQRIPTEPRRIDTPNQGTVGTSGRGNAAANVDNARATEPSHTNRTRDSTPSNTDSHVGPNQGTVNNTVGTSGRGNAAANVDNARATEPSHTNRTRDSAPSNTDSHVGPGNPSLSIENNQPKTREVFV